MRERMFKNKRYRCEYRKCKNCTLFSILFIMIYIHNVVYSHSLTF